mgnify:CR=1 FL=1
MLADSPASGGSPLHVLPEKTPGVGTPSAGGDPLRRTFRDDRPADAATQDPQPFRVQVGGDAQRLYRARRDMDDAELMANWMALLSETT